MSQGTESYEWLLNSCLEECRRSISRLEQIAGAASQKQTWLDDDLQELLLLERAAIQSLNEFRQDPDMPDSSQALTQEKLDRLQAKLLECFHHLASEGLPASICP